MKAIIKDFKAMCKNMNTVSKYTIKYGTIIILTLIAAALYCFYKTTVAESSLKYIILCNDFLYSIKECIGAVYVLPLIAEIIFIARGK